MQLHPWVIQSWPIIEHPDEIFPEIAYDLSHLGTAVSDHYDEFGRLLGHTIWGSADKHIGLAWDWTETLDGIFAISDPMAVVSNIKFVKPDGMAVSEPGKAVRLNRITHELHWQEEVTLATRKVRMTAPWSKRMRPPANPQHFRATELGGLTPTHR